MDYIYSDTKTVRSGTYTIDTMLGSPDRGLVQCPVKKPKMQDIINTVRNQVDENGQPIIQPVAVRVRDLPHDLQAILDQGGALDWVNRSIDQVVFTHNIFVSTSRNGGTRFTDTALGMALDPSTMNEDMKNIFGDGHTIIICVPRGDPDPSQGFDATGKPLPPRFTPEQLSETASIIVHETQHIVDMRNELNNTPHDFPMREKRFYDRILASEQLHHRSDLEQRAVGAQAIFTDEIEKKDSIAFSELPNTEDTFTRIQEALSDLQKDSDQYARHYRLLTNPISRTALKADQASRKLEKYLNEKFPALNDKIERITHGNRDQSPFAKLTPPPEPPTEFEQFRILRGDTYEEKVRRMGGASAYIESKGIAAGENPITSPSAPPITPAPFAPPPSTPPPGRGLGL